MTDFDRVKAYREEIESAANVARSIVTQTRQAAEALAHAEESYNSLLKCDAFMRDCLKKMHERLRAMEKEAEQTSKGVG
jgi:hypothetical protein